MPIVNTSELLAQAEKDGYAVGSFSVANLEMIQGVLKAAEELRSPTILQIAQVRLEHSPLHIIGPAMVAAAEKAKVPVAVHFDHGLTLEKIREALELGFTSVMIDGSRYPLGKNIRLTKEVIELARNYGAAVEAEIGCVGGSEDNKEDIAIRYTDVEEAVEFFNATRVDALAIAIGNAHGFYKCEPKLNFEVLASVNHRLDVPLVLHGGTGISEKDIRKCISLGIRKINVATSTFSEVERCVRELYVESGESQDYFKLHNKEIIGAYMSAARHIRIFGSAGRV